MKKFEEVIPFYYYGDSILKDLIIKFSFKINMYKYLLEI